MWLLCWHLLKKRKKGAFERTLNSTIAFMDAFKVSDHPKPEHDAKTQWNSQDIHVKHTSARIARLIPDLLSFPSQMELFRRWSCDQGLGAKRFPFLPNSTKEAFPWNTRGVLSMPGKYLHVYCKHYPPFAFRVFFFSPLLLFTTANLWGRGQSWKWILPIHKRHSLHIKAWPLYNLGSYLYIQASLLSFPPSSRHPPVVRQFIAVLIQSVSFKI